jgi:hypothetical protein
MNSIEKTIEAVRSNRSSKDGSAFSFFLSSTFKSRSNLSASLGAFSRVFISNSKCFLIVIMTKRKRINFLTMLALFSSFVLLASSLSPLLPPLVEDAAAQMHPEGCDKCIVIEYEGGHTAVIAGVESFTNMTTRQEQYNSYLWQFINGLVSDGFEIEVVMMEEDVRCEDDDDDNSTEGMYHVILDVPE